MTLGIDTSHHFTGDKEEAAVRAHEQALRHEKLKPFVTGLASVYSDGKANQVVAILGDITDEKKLQYTFTHPMIQSMPGLKQLVDARLEEIITPEAGKVTRLTQNQTPGATGAAQGAQQEEGRQAGCR